MDDERSGIASTGWPAWDDEARRAAKAVRVRALADPLGAKGQRKTRQRVGRETRARRAAFVASVATFAACFGVIVETNHTPVASTAAQVVSTAQVEPAPSDTALTDRLRDAVAAAARLRQTAPSGAAGSATAAPAPTAVAADQASATGSDGDAQPAPTAAADAADGTDSSSTTVDQPADAAPQSHVRTHSSG